MGEKRQPNERAEDGKWRPLLRRMDQLVVAALVALSLGAMGVYWVVQGGPRGELIEIDRAEPLTAKYLVDINKAEWPDSTRLNLLADIVFKAADLPEPPFDSRSTPGIDRASALLCQWLADGPLTFTEVLRRVRQSGLSKSSFNRAKRRLGVRHGGGCWALPAAVAV